jgi:hypothetical protein
VAGGSSFCRCARLRGLRAAAAHQRRESATRFSAWRVVVWQNDARRRRIVAAEWRRLKRAGGARCWRRYGDERGGVDHQRRVLRISDACAAQRKRRAVATWRCRRAVCHLLRRIYPTTTLKHS